MATESTDVMLELITGTLCPNKDIIAALITSAASIRNTNCTNRVLVELIRANSEKYKAYVSEYNFEFLMAMARDDEIIKTDQKFAEEFHQDLRNSTSHERDLLYERMIKMAFDNMQKVHSNGPKMLESPFSTRRVL